jgi:predicted nucleotidyltransferase
MTTTDNIETYRAAAREAAEQDAQLLDERWTQAWNLARKAAAVLRSKYGVSRVVVFGSLLRKEMFTSWSDVDIAAWGIAPDQTFRAIADVLFLSSHIEVNLVDVNTSSAALLATIEREGVDL